MLPMNEKQAKTDYKQVILNQIRQPLKLRLLLCSAIITGWYVLFFSPLSEETTAATAQMVTERKRVATARQIEQLKKAMAPYKGRVHAGTDIHELMQHVIAHMRTSSLKLLDLKPEKSKVVGPYETMGLKLTLEGRFADGDEFLKWVETDQRLLRIESIKLDPVTKDPGQLAGQVVLLSLGEKSASTEKAKPEVAKKKEGTVGKGLAKPATVKARPEAVNKTSRSGPQEQRCAGHCESQDGGGQKTMNAAKLIKLAPMLILVAFLAYAGYSIHASADDPAEDQAGKLKDSNTVVPDTVTAGNAVEDDQAGALRDPFQVGLKPGAVAGAHESEAASPDSDRLAEIVQGLKLDATFLQGRDEMAIINGRVYSKGEHLIIHAASDIALPPLIVVSVLPAKVSLRGGEKDYVLGYPDQLVLSQKPHNSPVRAPGKSMAGNRAGTSSRSDSAPRTSHSRGSRTGNH